MNNIKKFLSLAIMSLILVLVNGNTAYAAGSFAVSGGGSVAAGASTTITITTNNCAGQFSVSADNGAVVSAGSVWVDGSATVTVTAPGSGNFTVTVTASDVTSFDATPENVGGSQSVTGSVPAPTPTPSTPSTTTPSTGTTTTPSTPTTPEPEEDTRSTNNKLAELSVSEGTLSPAFDPEVQEYTVSVENVDKIEVSAKKDDDKASISGVGEHDLVDGENEISVVVTSEKGNYRTYVITVTKKELPSVFVTVGEEQFGVVRNVSEVEAPDGFDEVTVTVSGETVTAWNNNLLGITIIYLSNADGVADFYMYDEATGAIQAFRPLGLLGRNIYVFDIPEAEQVRDGMVYQSLVIEGNEIMGWTFEDVVLADYSVIHVMNDTGVMVDYLYSATDNAMVLAPDTAPVSSEAYAQLVLESSTSSEAVDTLNASVKELEKMNSVYVYIMGGLGALALILLIVLIVVCCKKSKNKNSDDKDYYQNDEFEDSDEEDLDDELEEDLDDDSEVDVTDDVEEDYENDIEYDEAVATDNIKKSSGYSKEIQEFEVFDDE